MKIKVIIETIILIENDNNNNIISSINSLCDSCILDKTYFDLKDYNRLIETFKTFTNIDLNRHNHAFFLLEKSQVINKNLSEVIDKINTRKKEYNDNLFDSFHYYIKGICLRKLNRDNESINSLLNHWIVSIFIAVVMVETAEFYHQQESIRYCNNLRHKLPQVMYILAQ